MSRCLTGTHASRPGAGRQDRGADGHVRGLNDVAYEHADKAVRAPMAVALPLIVMRLLLLIWLLLPTCVFAAMLPPSPPPQDEPSPTGPEAGLELAAELRNLHLENGEWKGNLKIQRRGPNVRTTTLTPVVGRAESDENEWKVAYLAGATSDSPAETLTVIHSTNGPNRYLYARATAPGASPGEAKPLSGAETDIPLAGSDLWLSDLGFEFYHWPGQNRLKGEFMRNCSCYVLESTHPDPKPGGYARVVTWIEKESGAPIQARAYGADRKLLKEFEVGHFKKINGKYELKDIVMSNLLTGSRTTLEFDLPGD